MWWADRIDNGCGIFPANFVDYRSRVGTVKLAALSMVQVDSGITATAIYDFERCKSLGILH